MDVFYNLTERRREASLLPITQAQRQTIRITLKLIFNSGKFLILLGSKWCLEADKYFWKIFGHPNGWSRSDKLHGCGLQSNSERSGEPFTSNERMYNGR